VSSCCLESRLEPCVRDRIAAGNIAIEEMKMDVALRRFLESVRPSARRTHLATYEDVVVALDCFMAHRRRSAQHLRPCEVRSFLGYWYLRHYHLLTGGSARRFCAALQVLVRWLCLDRPPDRARVLRREVARVARETARAARASELLQHMSPLGWSPEQRPTQDGFWEVVMLGSSHVGLRSLAERTPVGPVLLPPAVVRALMPGCILNLQLVREDMQWRVLEHGLCYPPVAAPALRAASLAPA
jgi:hypothetical protein